VSVLAKIRPITILVPVPISMALIPIWVSAIITPVAPVFVMVPAVVTGGAVALLTAVMATATDVISEGEMSRTHRFYDNGGGFGLVGSSPPRIHMICIASGCNQKHPSRKDKKERTSPWIHDVTSFQQPKSICFNFLFVPTECFWGNVLFTSIKGKPYAKRGNLMELPEISRVFDSRGSIDPFIVRIYFDIIVGTSLGIFIQIQ